MKNKGACRALCGVILGLVGLFMLPGGVLAEILYSQNFDGLSLGNLDGQDGWSADVGLVATTTQYFSAPNSLVSIGGLLRGTHSINPVSNGYIDFYMFAGNTYVNTGVATYATTGNNEYYITSSDAIGCDVGKWRLKLQKAVGYEAIQPCVVIDAWQRYQFEWRSSDAFYRGRVFITGTGLWGDWTDWVDPAGTSGVPEVLSIGTYPAMYFDDLIFGSGSAPDSDAPPPPADVKTLHFQQPLNNASTPDFSNYLLNYQYYTGTTTPVSLLFSINAYSEAGTFFGNSFIVESVVPDSTTTKSVFVPKTFSFLQNKWYNADASMGVVFPGGAEATTSAHFIIATSSSAIWIYPPSSTTTSTGFVLTCDPDSNVFEESLCKLGLALFIPKYEDFNDLLGTWDNVKNKIPLGYFTASKTALESLTTASGTSVSFSSLGEITDNIKTFFTGAFWLLFVFWAFNRIRNLEI